MFGQKKDFFKFCDLTGKVAVVTGSAMGMGKTHALLLAKAGAKIVACDISLEQCQLVVDEIIKAKGEAIAVKCDVSQKTDVDNVVAEAIKKFGKIDILVNNAGVYPFQPFLEMSEDNFMKVININLKGYFLMAQSCAKVMSKQKSGTIINIASVAAIIGFAGLAHYCASKGGIVAMSKAIALELASSGIRVNCIDPGAINTPGASQTNMTDEQRTAMLAPIPLKRQGKAEEISNAVLFFLFKRLMRLS